MNVRLFDVYMFKYNPIVKLWFFFCIFSPHGSGIVVTYSQNFFNRTVEWNMPNATVRFEMNSTNVMVLTFMSLPSINSYMGLNITASDVHVRGIYASISVIVMKLIPSINTSLLKPLSHLPQVFGTCWFNCNHNINKRPIGHIDSPEKPVQIKKNIWLYH